ncbi:hypothetical protein [Nodosilinea nodulosa]|uniref:hypothetical protein n=1 Tax=Nodosilinea nodulosa TaxID=416001 RepID=UPI0002D61784|nr:hypothetical protein [Nodosilinea nodulosa]
MRYSSRVSSYRNAPSIPKRWRDRDENQPEDGRVEAGSSLAMIFSHGPSGDTERLEVAQRSEYSCSQPS